ncbi:MAG: multiple sugar transport system permease protein, partial [Gaiellaceae bacterium]|nr:multiple sugar transport system permease protein [Gaiellaceae bacterium]
MAAVAEAATFERRVASREVRRRRFLIAVADNSLIIVVAIAFLLPFVFMLATALMTNSQALGPNLWPSPFRWRNFVDIFHQAPLLRWTLNTAIYSGLATLGLLLSSIPVAYALSRLRWRGREAVFLLVMIALMMPPQVSVVPIYVMWAKMPIIGN